MDEYQRDAAALRRDLPHRSDDKSIDWFLLSKRLGWLTWEDCNEVVPGTCPWFNKDTALQSHLTNEPS